MKKIMAITLSAIMLAGCSAPAENTESTPEPTISAKAELKQESKHKIEKDEKQGCDVLECGKYADLSGYEGFAGDNEVFYEITPDEFIEKFDAEESFIVYFGFEKCPWCNAVISVLHEVADENDVDIAYINTRANEEWSSNMDIDRYDDIVERVGDCFDLDDDGKQHLYVPMVIAVRKGSVVGYHEGATDSYELGNVMTEAEVEELTGIYQEMIDIMEAE